MKAKLLGYEPKRKILKPRALPIVFKHKAFYITNMNGEKADRIISHEHIHINIQCEVQFYHTS